jgi:hypothetical protein
MVRLRSDSQVNHRRGMLMAAMHLDQLFVVLFGLACWLDLLINGSHTLRARMTLIIIPVGAMLFLFNPSHSRLPCDFDVVIQGVLSGIGVGGCLANLCHGHWGYRLHGWIVLVLWGLLINSILLNSISYMVNWGHWSPGWYVVLLLENVLVVIAAIYISVTAERTYNQRKLAMEGLCPSCGYDLQGSADASNCPECGHDIKPLTA